MMPEVNQIEFHPYLADKDIVDACRERGILVQAYAPLGNGVKENIHGRRKEKFCE